MRNVPDNGWARAALSPSASPDALLGSGGLPEVFWDASRDLMVVADERGRLIAANPAWERTLGWTLTNHARLNLAEIIHEDDRPAILAALTPQGAGLRFDDLELRLRTASGGVRQISWSGVNDGSLWYATGCDVTNVRQAEQVARDAAEFWHATIDSIPDRVAVLDEAGCIVAVNEAWRRFSRRTGRGDRSDLTRSYLDICDRAGDEPGAVQAARGIRDLLGGRRDPVAFDYALGDQWFTFTATAFLGRGLARVVVTHADVTERRRTEEEARIQATVLDQLEIAVVGTDRDARITRWSAGAEKLYGWSQAEVLGRVARDLLDARPVTAVAGDEALVDGRYELNRKDGSRFVGHTRWLELFDNVGQVAGTLGVALDLTVLDRAQTEARAARTHLQAVTDSMSEGLFALGPDGGVTLMNRAAEVMLGWTLQEVRGHPLHAITRHHGPDGRTHTAPECPVGRAGDQDRVVKVEDDVFVRRDGLEVPVSYTVTPLRTADGEDGWVVVFMDATHVRAEQERLQDELSAVVWIQRVQIALEEDRFTLYAQPIVDLSTMTVTQHELLLRVVEKDGTISPPGEYLATAEKYGLIQDIDRWVLRRAIDLAAAGHAVEANVSAASTSNPALIEDVAAWLDESGADPANLVFEITETTAITNEQAGRRFVQRAGEIGCQVALDDFGTGYSGFAYLRQLPVNFLKIDIEFVRDVCVNSASRHVVEAVVQLAKGFGLRTVAEGVEDRETLELLVDLGVDFAQGYYLGRPAPLTQTALPTDLDQS